ncbi:MAG: ThiF family adenylyltransferase [Thermomicrobiales bacterium]|nr:ThiF family adenylyltransferase [Thermomicrobiales bacterium]
MPHDFDQSRRYIRQTIFAPIGKSGQDQIGAAKIAVVGCGALGSAIADQLARAGVGSLRLIDRDFVEIHNLQRQSLYTEADVRNRMPKALAAYERLSLVNSTIEIEPVVDDLNSGNIARLLDGADLIIDGTDNFETRYLINDFAVANNRPWIYGGVIGSYGMTMTIRPGITACIRCVFPEAPPPGVAPTCDTAGVIGPIVQLVASYEVSEALKYLVGAIDKLNTGLLAIDVWQLTSDRVPTGGPNPTCPCCGLREFTYLNAPADDRETVLCGQDSVQVRLANPVEIDLGQLAKRLSGAGEVVQSKFLLRFTDAATDRELTVFPDGRAIVRGTTDGDEAKRLYATYVGN